MKKLISALLIIATMLSVALTGCTKTDNTDKSWDKVKNKGELILGLDASFPPMGFKDDAGNIIGFDIDIAKEVCSRLGIKLKLQPINWDAKEQELNTYNIDCIWNGFSVSDERKKQVLFSDPYMKNHMVLLVRSDSTYKTLADLAGKSIGLQAGSSALDALNAAKDFKATIKDKKPVELKDNVAALLDLENKGVDAVLLDEIVARYYMTSKNKNYKVLDETLSTEDYAIGFRLKDKALEAKVQETLNAMAKDGKLAEISKTWFGTDITTISK